MHEAKKKKEKKEGKKRNKYHKVIFCINFNIHSIEMMVINKK
jgi:hypothetical protein